MMLGLTLEQICEWVEAKHLCEKVVSQTQLVYGERDEQTISALALLATVTE